MKIFFCSLFTMLSVQALAIPSVDGDETPATPITPAFLGLEDLEGPPLVFPEEIALGLLPAAIENITDQYDDAVHRSAFGEAEWYALQLYELYAEAGNYQVAEHYANARCENIIRRTIRDLEEARTPNLEAFRTMILNPEQRFELILEPAQQELLTRIRQEADLLVRDTLIVQLLQGQYVMQHVINAFNQDMQQQANGLEWLVGTGARGLHYLVEQYRRMGWGYRANQLEANQNRFTGDANWRRVLVEHLHPPCVSK
ncbi:MAG: hypothetical protein JKY15_07955 [Deltaproteobacteria bacterium]|nr:hypothetical protein [Deltaproteobacteria bacterium]